MGCREPGTMRAGLIATKNAAAATVGTITLDSYTRIGDLEAVRTALRDDIELNGYPIVSYDPATTRWVLDGVQGDDFPVQVRHGSARPLGIFSALVIAGIYATEGGPVSYCLPYGRTSLAESVRNWHESCELFAQVRQVGVEPHLETFGGCMLGQLCPPSQLVAISLLEALFFYRHGLRSISVSYAQQTNVDQDREAILALRRLCGELLPTASWHVVVYAYMGLYPRTVDGARRLLAQAAELAVATGSERLIVKTVAESHRIPTIAENVAALEHASLAASSARPADRSTGHGDTQVYREAVALVDAVLDIDPRIDRALLLAFERGYLDIPYCVHPDNQGRSRSYIDGDGWLRWADVGRLPLRGVVGRRWPQALTSSALLDALTYVRDTFDGDAIDNAGPRPLAGRRHG
jgi:methylaspartate mutase epsilon subunit